MRIKNWRKFQHYKDRNPPWVKLHVEMMQSQDWIGWSDASKLLACACLMIAARYEGEVPTDAVYVQRVAFLSEVPDFKPLIDSGFLEDASTVLADASNCLPSVSVSVSGKGSVRENHYAFESGVIRLTQKDFDGWKRAFSHLDLGAELYALAEWAGRQKSWFNAVSSALAKRNREAKVALERAKANGGFKYMSGIEGVI